jgi:hypothetical protein
MHILLELSFGSIRRIINSCTVPKSDQSPLVILLILPSPPTDPAPFITAMSTSHVHASCVLLDWNLTIRTISSSILFNPLFNILSLCFLTRLPRVPGDTTLEAHWLTALRALDFLSITISFYYNVFAFWIRTILFILARHYLLIFLELQVLIISLLVDILCQKVVS